jgi:hypothetical protein
MAVSDRAPYFRTGRLWLNQQQEKKFIEPDFESTAEGAVNCRERLGGLLRYDHREREIYDFSFWTLRRDLLLS